MKNTPNLRNLAIFALLFTFASCEKEQCQECTVTLYNAELYTYQMTFTGQTGFPLKPSETREIKIEAGKTYAIKGRPNTTFAHNDFSRSVKCDGECGEVLVIVED